LQDGSETIWMTEHGFEPHEPDHPNTFFDFPYIHPVDAFTPPDWVKDAVFYQIFPERFANGDPANDPEGVQPWGGVPTPHNFFGGDLQGVIDHLDYLEELGINALYFTPVFEAPTNHKYDTRDYFKVDPHFGTNETLKELVAQCHARGIRVVLDAVFNHSGGTFPPFLDCKEHGEQSQYAGWFHVREWPLTVKDGIPTYETFAFVPSMPKINTSHPEAKRYFLDVAKYWIEEIGIDGWRLDVANEVEHKFWREFRQIVKSVKPDAYILGEIWHESIMWLQGDQFDAVMNYTFTTSVLDFVVEGKLDAKGFADRVSALLAAHPSRVNEATFNLLGSHDTPRLLTLCGGNKDKMKLATAIQFTFEGAPCIYYGDEVGLDGGPDPGCRKCMEWDPARQDQDMLAHYRSLIALRKQYPALRSGKFRILHAEAGSPLLVYERSDEDARLVILLNNSDQAHQVTDLIPEGNWHHAITGAAPQTSDPIKLTPYGLLILVEAK
jgi:cyclomaltodextrinase / maltogenic alpha-amylase / neopullulanase